MLDKTKLFTFALWTIRTVNNQNNEHQNNEHILPFAHADTVNLASCIALIEDLFSPKARKMLAGLYIFPTLHTNLSDCMALIEVGQPAFNSVDHIASKLVSGIAP